jgi:hypothetical protein
MHPEPVPNECALSLSKGVELNENAP